MEDAPILDGFYESEAYLTPAKMMKVKLADAKDYVKKHKIKTAILVFSSSLNNNPEVFKDMIKIGEMQAGEDKHPLYALNGVLLTVPFVGNPNASGLMEELYEIGIRNFLAAGSAGLIDETYDESKMFVVERAIRDEGGSYHYAPPETYTYTHPDITKAIKKTFEKLNIPYECGTTWTMDSYYRESKQRIEKRKQQGAVAVEMECATWCVVAKYLGAKFGQFLYFSDKVAQNDWSQSGTHEHRLGLKNKITLLCLEIAKNIR